MNIKNKCISAIILLNFLLFNIYAKEQKVLFDKISVLQGLSHSSVYSIAQDKQGYLWFATQDGLNKYDGYDFKKYFHDPNDSTSLSYSSISIIYSDSKDNLWVGTWGGGLNRFDRSTGSFVRYYSEISDSNNLGSQRISFIMESQKEELWIGTGEDGLFIYNYNSETFRYFNSSNSNLYHDRIWGLAEDGDGTIWIATETGLNKFTPSNGIEKVHFNNSSTDSLLNTDRIRCLYFDNSDNLWLGTQNGLMQFNKAKESFKTFLNNPKDNESIGSNIINTIYEDNSGNLWIGTLNGGLNLFNKETDQFVVYKHSLTKPNSIANNDIRSIIHDKSGNIWIGTRGGGINKFNLNIEPFVHITSIPFNPNSLNDKNVRSVYEDDKQNIWIGTNEGGLNKIDFETGKFSFYKNSDNSRNSILGDDVFSIIQDRRGNIWLGTADGLNKFDADKEIFTNYLHDPDDNSSLSGNLILSILEDNFGNIWIGTYRNGLNKLNIETQKFEHFKSDPKNINSLSGDEVYSLAKDSVGNIWAGTVNGISKINPETEDIKNYSNIIQNQQSINVTVYSLAIHEKLILIGTNVGFFIFDPETKSIESYTESDGLTNNFVYGIVVDDKGKIWLSTNKGISCFDLDKKNYRNYNIHDGLQSNVFNVGAYHKGKSGKLYFGGINGLTVFNPLNIKINNTPPPIVITDFSLFNTPAKEYKSTYYLSKIEKAENFDLNFNQNFITIEFSALDFVNPLKNQYMYKMEGVDIDWNNAGTKRFATYTNLDPGDYTFIVKASNNDGLWNEEGFAFDFTISPPYWRTWWFISLSTIALLSIAFTFYKWRVDDLTNHQKALEKHIHEKEIAERRLIASQERYELAVKGSTDGIWDWDIVKNEVYLSPQWKSMLGYNNEEIENNMSSFVDRLHPNDKIITQNTINDFVENGGVFDTEFRLLKKDNNYGWFRARGIAVRNDESVAVRMSGVMSDITVRKEAEEKLRNNEILFNIITSGASDIILILDSRGNRIYASNSYEKHFENEPLSEEENLFKGIHPEDREKVKRSFTKALVSKENQSGECRLILPDGTIRYLEYRGNVILNEDSKPHRVVVIARDITDYKLAKEEIVNLNRNLENKIKARTSELENTNKSLHEVIAVRERVERVQDAMYLISQAIHKSPDLKSLFSEIHSIVEGLMSAKNFYIALYNPKTEIVSFPYRVDEYDRSTKQRKNRKGLTEYILRTGEPLLSNFRILKELILKDEVVQSGHVTAVWLGIPLKINKQTLGVMAVQDYHNEDAYGEEEKQLLIYISEQVAFAIEKKRNEDAEKKRIEIVLKNRNVLIDLAKMDISNFDQALPKILETTAKTIDIERVGFWKLGKQKKTLVCETLYSRSKDSIDKDAKGIKLPVIFSKVFEKIKSTENISALNKTLISNYEETNNKKELLENYLQTNKITSIIDSPVWFKGKIIGTICLEHVGNNREFILEEEDFINSIATMISLAMETSTRRVAEKNLKISEQHYKLVVENSNDGIIVGQNGFVKYANPRVVEIMGYTFDELTSKKFAEFIHPDDRKMGEINHMKRMKGEEVMNFYELRLIHKNGNTVITEVSAELIEWHGNSATLNFYTDINERKKAEEEIKKSLEKERELNELKSRFISMTSHEFRTPLTSIMSSAEIIGNYYDKLNEEQRTKNLDRIRDNVKHMTQLLNDVLSLGKTEAKKMEMKRFKVDLKRLCRDTVEQFEIGTLKKTKHTLKFREKNLAKDALVDPKLIRQILDNLISNAIKYSPAKSEVIFEAECREDKIMFTIRDRGIGIPEEAKEKIFEPFYRAKNVGKISGTGLGMAIIKDLVELHGGTLKLESEVEKGTTIFVKLPLIKA